MNNEIIYLGLYTLLWGVTLYYMIKKNHKEWNVAIFIVSTYFVFALFSVVDYLFNYSSNQSDRLTLFPLLYLFLMMLLGLRPVRVYANRDYKSIEAPSSSVFNALLYFYIFLSVIIVPDIVANMQDGLIKLMVDDSGGKDLYMSKKSVYVENDGEISNIFAVLYNSLSPICVFLFFYYLTLYKRNKWILIALAISIVVKILYSLSRGQRTDPTMIGLTFFATFFLMRPYLEKKYRKKFLRIIIVAFVFPLIPFMALTNSRFGNSSSGSVGSIVSYAGQAPIIFDKYCLDAGGIRYGDRTAPEFKRLVGFKDVPRGEPSRRFKYAHLKVDSYWFYTYVGDFVLDYGPIGAVCLFVVFSSVFVNITRHRRGGAYPFHKLLLVYFAMSVCVQGGMYLFNYAHYGNYQIMMIFFLYLVFLYDYNKKKQNKSQVSSSYYN